MERHDIEILIDALKVARKALGPSATYEDRSRALTRVVDALEPGNDPAWSAAQGAR